MFKANMATHKIRNSREKVCNNRGSYGVGREGEIVLARAIANRGGGTPSDIHGEENLEDQNSERSAGNGIRMVCGSSLTKFRRNTAAISRRADNLDMVLVAKSHDGLQALIDRCLEFYRGVGWDLMLESVRGSPSAAGASPA
ncbi:Hypothetical predicted protein [Octopus vulgaris]|uniref:Uncharacterized protein n=1 Tax=Octopus vulgaris TaxID=6645 RepID=A0AA36F2W9_OCTVU|nr:Hypothetical predicted protein [Octopus vulgaris]